MGGYHRISISLLAFLYCVFVPKLHAQERYRLGHKIDSLLSHRYMQADIDTAYIIRPQAKWTLTGRFNMSGANIGFKGYINDTHFKSEMNADYKSTLSLGVSYLGLSLNLSLNPAKIMGHYSDFEFNLNSYGRRFGFDFIYQNAKNFTGWHQNEDQERITLPTDLLTLKTLNLNAFYCFNNRRFSFPAAFAQSYIQRQSAGSFLVAISSQGQSGKVKGDQEYSFKMANIGIGAGYGYNYVPSRNWLFHISGLPTFIVYSNTSLTNGNAYVPMKYHFPEVIITGRGAIVHQRNNKFFGLSMVFIFTNIGNEENLSVSNIKWLTRLFFGFRF